MANPMTSSNDCDYWKKRQVFSFLLSKKLDKAPVHLCIDFLKVLCESASLVSLWGDFWQDCKCFFPAWKVFFIDLINEIWFR